MMSRVRSRDTGPELQLRRALWAAGARGYRLYGKLPGRPDIIFRRARLAVFVDGCFWHRCSACNLSVPRTPYWQTKIARNVDRDAKTNDALAALGWKVARLWEHEVEASPADAALQIVRLLPKGR
jgi:DNA mismatch endonuclease Vsr